jgi:hypothetical protein
MRRIIVPCLEPRLGGVAALALAVLYLGGCTTSEVLVAHSVNLERTNEVVSEEHLLDVAVVVFDPGVPEGEVDKDVLEELLKEGTFVHIRRTESRYMAVQLKDTLQRSGHWGTVWVTPTPSNVADVNVTAEILHSDGGIVRIRARAEDATGRVWLNERYEMETAAGAYNRQRYPDLDPYQDVFNSIANDLAAARARLTAEDVRRVRTLAELRYANELTPEAFDGYVARARNGQYQLARLPAAEDPMFDRTLRVRQRERLFLDTLNQHYEYFSREAGPSYDGWRQYSREESMAIRELTRSARWRTGLGIATIVASVVYGSQSSNNSFADRVIRDAMLYVGMDVLRTGAMRRVEKQLHTSTLEELSAGFDDEVRPLVVEIEGTQRRLTGTADAQYDEWRGLLRELFITETGFVPEDLDVYSEPEPEPLRIEFPVLQPEPAEEAEGEEVAAGAEGAAGGGA